MRRRPHVPTRARARASAGAIAALVALAACNSSSPNAQGPHAPSAPPDAIPASIAIGDADVAVGMATGTLRSTEHVASFKIGATPVTGALYQRCVDAGVCAASSIAAASADSVQILSSVDDAKHYCAWVGGDLPRVGEWVYAARGAAVHRFPWGDVVGTCAQSGRLSLVNESQEACCGGACSDALTTNKHPGGRSPVGVSDVLAFPRELVARGTDGASSQCGADACVVSGFLPGAMDVLTPVTSTTGFSFRCVWRDSQ
jgi:hypothetical protein